MEIFHNFENERVNLVYVWVFVCNRNGCNSGNGRRSPVPSLFVESPLQPESATSKAMAPNYNYYSPGGGAITIHREIKKGWERFPS